MSLETKVFKANNKLSLEGDINDFYKSNPKIEVVSTTLFAYRRPEDAPGRSKVFQDQLYFAVNYKKED